MKSNRKQIIRLTESDLHKVIKESVNRVLNEETDVYGQEWSYEDAVVKLKTSFYGHMRNEDTKSLNAFIDTCSWIQYMFPNINIQELLDGFAEELEHDFKWRIGYLKNHVPTPIDKNDRYWQYEQMSGPGDLFSKERWNNVGF